MTQSSRSILERLEEHLERVCSELFQEFVDASDKHAGTPEAVAHSREQALRSMIRRFFPEPFKVTKGAIYDSFGSRSQSIDCVICSPNHPYLVGKDGAIEIVLVDGVFAALELKPDLTDLPVDFGATRQQQPELVRGLKQIRSVKKLKRAEPAVFPNPLVPESSHLADYSVRCPAYILCDKTVSIVELARYVGSYYVKSAVPIEEQVDVIYSLKEGMVAVSKAPDFSSSAIAEGPWYPHLVAYPPSATTAAYFFRRLVGEIAPEVHLSTPVLERYLGKMAHPTAVFGCPTTTGEA